MMTRLNDWQSRGNHWAIGSLIGVGLCLASGVSHSAPGPWELDVVDSQNDIEIHTRERGNGFVEFKAVTRINTSLSSLVALLQDVDRLPKWSYRTTFSTELEKVSARESIIYSVAGLPWPFKDRDVVVRSRLQQDPVSLAVMVTATALPDYLPSDPAYVRVPFLESSWSFVPTKDGIVEVRFQGYGDGGGSLSKGLMNWFSALVISEGPHQTLLGLRRVISQKRYRQASVSIIREPVTTSTVKSDVRSRPHGISNRLSMMSPSSK